MSEFATKQFQDDEITIDFYKIWNIIWYRKWWILGVYAIVIALAVGLTFVMPKKYKVETKLLIQKSNYTNLSDINPFIVGDMASSKGGGLSSMLGGSSSLDDEIAILKSDDVLEKVIKENDLKYTKGSRIGQDLLPSHFANDKNLSIKSGKDGSVIDISYKSSDRKKAFDIVNSIMKNYITEYEKINTDKAKRDRSFLEDEFARTQALIDEKSNQIKNFLQKQGGSIASSESSSAGNVYQNLLQKYDKRLIAQIKTLPGKNIESKKLELELAQEIKKYEMLKERYEWSKLVEELSRNASKVKLLTAPTLPEITENSEPKLIVNVLLSLVVSFTIACCLVFALEFTDSKQTYMDAGNNYKVYKNIDNIDFMDLILDIQSKNITELAVVSLVDTEKTLDFVAHLETELADDSFRINVTSLQNSIKDNLENIRHNNNVILLTEIGFTARKIEQKLLNCVDALNKNYALNIILDKNYIKLV